MIKLNYAVYYTNREAVFLLSLYFNAAQIFLYIREL